MKLLKQLWSWTGTFLVALVFALLIGIFIIQPYKVDGHSMDPTLYDKERMYVSKLPHTFSYMPDYGDIVIIDSRVDRTRTFKDDILENPLFQLIVNTTDRAFFVKRVIGKPGDTLEFKNHKVYRNGQALDEPYLNEQMNYESTQKWVVPEGHVFVMGDNRNHSEDSRMIGYIPLDHVIGKKIF
ncbi:signal peptidase I [Paenibacillus thalictri]|uniref:Signal peptidase I n=1 Tax=Paenibacillus thalictri TaxID=2527873 RepID=A0A4Q9DKL2_9BACL|nr:signal peptidase I [Paenibacillus thalictri]TBL75323.1 signal peptidase I [Paenibacillus thalictri]